MIVVLVLCGGGAPSGQQSKVACEKTGPRNGAGGCPSRAPTGESKWHIYHKFKAQICLEAALFHSWPCGIIINEIIENVYWNVFRAHNLLLRT